MTGVQTCALPISRQLFKECIDDIIIMQSSAVATAYIGVALFKRPGTKLYMVQYNIEGLNTLLKRFLYSLAIKKIDGIICPQKRVGEAYRKPYCVVSDYIYTGMKKKEDIPYERKRYDFCVIGLISKDKGVLEVAECLKGTNYHVLIAGLPQSDEIRQALQKICSEAENIDLKLYYLSEDDYKKSILVSRYCILNYSGAYSKHSSGVVFDIIFRGIPVIGRDCEAMSFIKEYGLGEIITDFNDFDPSSVLDKKKYETYQVNIQRYFELHRQYISDIKDFVSK